jgi:hypothetical protein
MSTASGDSPDQTADPMVDVTGRTVRAAAATLHRHRWHAGAWRDRGDQSEHACDCLDLAMVAANAMAATLEAYYLARLARDAGVDPPGHVPGAHVGELLPNPTAPPLRRPAPRPRRPLPRG